MSGTCPVCQKHFDQDYRKCPYDGADLVTIEASDDLMGTLVKGRYELKALLGEGGTGVVYRAWDQTEQRDVAIKVLRRELSPDQRQVSRFIAEARLTRDLSHPNTRRVYQVSQDADGLLFIAMEYLEGHTLSYLLQAGGALPLARAAVTLGQVTAALAEAHQKGIIHRDLKPANVMLIRDGGGREMARVLDFGIARQHDTRDCGLDTRSGFALGTPAYMSPEAILGEEVDERSDIYTLGILLYEMIVGVRPFTAPTPIKVMLKHLNDAPPTPRRLNPRAEINAELLSLIQDTLAKRPEDRPASAMVFGRRLVTAARQPLAPPDPEQAADVTQRARPPAIRQDARPKPGPSAAPPRRPPLTLGEGVPEPPCERPDVAPVKSNPGSLEFMARDEATATFTVEDQQAEDPRWSKASEAARSLTLDVAGDRPSAPPSGAPSLPPRPEPSGQAPVQGPPAAQPLRLDLARPLPRAGRGRGGGRVWIGVLATGLAILASLLLLAKVVSVTTRMDTSVWSLRDLGFGGVAETLKALFSHGAEVDEGTPRERRRRKMMSRLGELRAAQEGREAERERRERAGLDDAPAPEPEPERPPARRAPPKARPKPPPIDIVVRVGSDPPGASIIQRGEVIGETPAELRAPGGEGSVEWTLSLEGFRSRAIDVSLQSDGAYHVILRPL